MGIFVVLFHSNHNITQSKMNKEYVIGKIVEIEPCTVYMGEVSDQIITIELQNKSQILLFDSEMLCKNELLGKSVNVKIYAETFNASDKFKRVEEPITLTIYNPILETGNPGGDCNGKIVRVLSTGNKCFFNIILNVGEGNVILDGISKEKIEKLKVGDYLKIKGARFDLKEVKLIDVD